METRRERYALWITAAIAIAAIIFGAIQYREVQRLRILGEVARQRAFFNLLSHVENMEGNLAKARASSTPAQRSAFLTACWSHSQAAQENISVMGMTDVDLSAMQKFIAQVGDFCLVLSQKLARGDAVTSSEWEALSTCETAVKDLARALADTGASAFRGGSSQAGMLPFGLAASLPSNDDAWLRGFSEIDSLVQSVPSPAYDGPFSDRALESKPLANPGPEISPQDAERVALSFMNREEHFREVGVTTIDGAVPAFLVTGTRDDGSQVSVAVAKAGGAVLWGMDQKSRSTPQLDLDAARQAAAAFLDKLGMDRFIETGWRKPETHGDRVVFTYAGTAPVTVDGKPVQVVLYPEMVKVEVALDTGEIIGYDAMGYLTNAVSSELKPPLVSASQARAVLNPELNQEGEPRLTVIPLVSGRAVMAWEFRVTHGGDTYLIYINAMTGQEEMVLQMVIDEAGSLTM